MAISGELLSVDLSNVFQMLSLNRKRGLLHIRDQDNVLNERWIVFDEDRIGLYEVPQEGDVWALLVDSGALSYEDYCAARGQAQEYGSHHDRLLRQKGLVDEETLARAARRVQEEHLLEIFLWREVTFALDENRVPEPLAQRELYGIDLLVMEAARRQDEWQRAIELLGAADDIWALPPMPKFATPATEHLEATARLVLDEVDGVRGTSEIMVATGLPRYHVDLALCRLMQEKLLRRLNGPELVDQATALLAADRVDDATRLLELANDRNPGDVEIHLRLAEAHLKNDEVSRATEHYKACAESLLAMERTREAVDIFHDVLVQVPTDFETLKRAIELVAAEIDDYSEIDEELFAQGVKLFHFHLESSQYDEANDLLGLLIEIAPHDVGLNLQRARLLVKTGYVEEGVDIYLKVAGKLLAAKDVETAEKIYRTVRSTDPINDRVREYCQQRLTQIEDLRRKRNRRKRAGLGIGLMLVVLAASGLGYFVYQDRADARLAELRHDHENLQDSKDWKAAREAYVDFGDRYPLCFASIRAKAMIAEADKMIARFEREESIKARRVEADRAALFGKAEEAFAAAVLNHSDRRLRKARSLYEEALRFASDAGRRAWALDAERDLGARIDGLTRHIEREDMRVEVLEKARREGRLAEAHALGRALLSDASSVVRPGEEVRVVDRETVEKLVIPFRVDRVPANASLTLDGRPVPPGPLTFELGAGRPTARLGISAPGYRGVTRELHWQRGSYQTTVILDRVPASAADIGQRITDWVVQGGRLIGADTNGGLHRLDSAGLKVESSWRPTRLTTRIGRPEGMASGVLVVSSRQALVVDVTTRRRVWERRFKADVVAFARHGERLLIAQGGESPNLSLWRVGSTRPDRTWPLPGLAVKLVFDKGDHFAISLAGGRLVVGRAATDVLTVAPTRARPGRVVFAGDRLVFADEDGGVSGYDLRSGTTLRFWAPPGEGTFVQRGPEAAGGRAVFTNSEGDWFVVDRAGSLRQGTGRLDDVDADRGRPVVDLGAGRHVLIPRGDGRYLELDLEGMRCSGLLGRAGRRSGGAAYWQGRLITSYLSSSEVDIFEFGN